MNEFKQYIGIKVLKARPMPCPKDTHKSKAGDPGYEVEYEDGYRSWSPKEVFDKAYTETTGLSYGLAMEAKKRGHKVFREAWVYDPFEAFPLYMPTHTDKHSNDWFIVQEEEGSGE